MMGHRGKLKSGEEWDALTPWRRFLRWHPGQRKRIKRGYNKRQRKIAKMRLRLQLEDVEPQRDTFTELDEIFIDMARLQMYINLDAFCTYRSATRD